MISSQNISPKKLKNKISDALHEWTELLKDFSKSNKNKSIFLFKEFHVID